jgi:hypothetical protein
MAGPRDFRPASKATSKYSIYTKIAALFAYRLANIRLRDGVYIVMYEATSRQILKYLLDSGKILIK